MRTRTLLVLVMLVAVVIAVLIPGIGRASAAAPHGAGAGAAGSPARSCTVEVWSVVPSPNTSATVNYLTGVSSVSAHDAWAVGYTYVPSSATEQSFAEHYNGTTWSMVSMANPSATMTQVNGVATVSADNAWAVGSYTTTGQFSKTLIEHWNGTAWSQVASPNAGTNGALLAGIAVVSASDIWAVGGYSDQSGQFPLFEQWNGTSWSIVLGANTGTNSAFVQTALALSSTNVWAAGYYTLFGGTLQTFVEHWDGAKWSIIPSPNAGSSTLPNSLSGLAAVTPSNVWVVGQYTYTTSPSYLDDTLAEQWNGTKWSLVSSPSLGTSSLLSGVAAIPGTNQLWGVGQGTNSGGTLQLALIERWDGTQWSIGPSPNPASASSSLTSVAAVSASDAWAVGYTTAAPPASAAFARSGQHLLVGPGHPNPASGGRPIYTLIEHYHQLPTGRPCA